MKSFTVLYYCWCCGEHWEEEIYCTQNAGSRLVPDAEVCPQCSCGHNVALGRHSPDLADDDGLPIEPDLDAHGFGERLTAGFKILNDDNRGRS